MVQPWHPFVCILFQQYFRGKIRTSVEFELEPSRLEGKWADNQTTTMDCNSAAYECCLEHENGIKIGLHNTQKKVLFYFEFWLKIGSQNLSIYFSIYNRFKKYGNFLSRKNEQLHGIVNLFLRLNIPSRP